ncbi:MAG: hypothetical protein AAF899_06955 [Pseudomonadota bacterium]
MEWRLSQARRIVSPDCGSLLRQTVVEDSLDKLFCVDATVVDTASLEAIANQWRLHPRCAAMIINHFDLRF